MEQQAQDWFAANAPKSPPPAAPPAEPKQAAANTDWFAANAPKTSAPDTDGTSPTDMHSLASSNPNNEGLYHMKDADGHSFAIPFSNVEMADDFRNSFSDEKEAQRYEKDLKASKPGLWAKLRTKVYDVTEPTLDHQKGSKDFEGGVAATTEMQNNVLKRVGRTLFGIPDMVPQVYQSIKKMASDDPKISAEGEDEINNLHPGSQIAERVKEFKKDYKKDPQLAFANTAGDAMAFYLADKLGEAAHGAPAAAKAKGMELLRRTVGTDVRATEDIARKIKTANEKAELEYKEASPERKKQLEQVIADNDEKLKAHEQAVKDRTELVQKHVDASRKAAESKARLANHVNDIHDSAVKWFGKQYDTLGELTKDVRVPFAPLVEAVEEANLQDIAGSDTKVPVFEDVFKRAKGEINEPAQKPKGWESASKAEKDEWEQNNLDKTGISYKDLTGYYRELGKILKSPSTLGDVKDAVVRVRSKIEELQRSAAQLADEKAAATAAANKQEKPRSAAQLNYSIAEKYKNFAESYREPGSPGYKAINATNIDKATDPFLKNMDEGELSDVKQQVRGRERADGKKTNATEWAGRNSASDTAGKRLKRSERRAQTEKLIDQARKAQEDLKALPKPGAPPEPPEPTPLPEPDPPKPETISPEMLKVKKQEAIDNFFESLRKNRVRIGISGFGTLGLAELVSHAMSHLLGTGAGAVETIGMGLAGAQIFGPTIMTKLLKVPGVVEALKVITKAETETLEKLPPAERVAAEKNIIAMTQVAKSKGILKPSDPTPMAKFAKADLAKAKAAEAIKPEPPPEEEPPAVTEPEPDTPPTAPAAAEPEPEPEKSSHEIQMVRVGGKPATPWNTGEKAPSVLYHHTTPENAAAILREGYDATKSARVSGPHVNQEAGIGIHLRESPEMKWPIADDNDVEISFTPKRPLRLLDASPLDSARTSARIAKEHGLDGFRGEDTNMRGEQKKYVQYVIFDPKLLSASEVAPKPVETPSIPARQRAPLRRLDELHLDPKRFQYKLGGNKAGVTDALSDVEWDQNIADPIHTWVDPEDGKEYVVNGHHRYDLAKKSGAEHIEISQMDNKIVKTASEARKMGALKNIADGNGTSVDAAKFFRETGLKLEDLKKENMSLKKSTASEGLAMARLDDKIFDRVVDGRLDPKLAAAIGEATDVVTDQEAILKDIARQEKSGVKVTPDQIRESARLIKAAPSFTQTTGDLFGEHNETRNLFMEMGEVSDYIQKQLASEKRAFGSVSKEGTGNLLERTGNKTNPAANAAEATKLAQQRELYNKRSAQHGPISRALQEAASRLAEGEDANEIKRETYDEVRDLLSEELGEADGRAEE